MLTSALHLNPLASPLYDLPPICLESPDAKPFGVTHHRHVEIIWTPYSDSAMRITKPGL